MTEPRFDLGWMDDVIRGLHALTSDQVPALEITLLDAVVDWLFSPQNPQTADPQAEYDESHAGTLVSTMFTAVDTSRTFLPKQEPAVTDAISAARARMVEGAHELSAQGPEGISILVSRAMPAVLGELSGNSGERAKQAHGVFVYLLYALALGTRTEHDPVVMDGVVESFVGWDGVLRGGYALPWRPVRPAEDQAE
ncbi:hypothetical protein I4I73_11260 [Pseudonocardia sp. KRD-184]|uniref:TetR family transcriptional regulator n=1 Tax=Pseudonocardia oceani TaxID=2792013 RepID=A0ABS6UES1_9PSEU|nr:hypothetical protein [Pseudonocardia oceani]MBW0089501.1 hypothetical protein [Pseudonocardia oceani]MBW0096563.1 hypothetical protein [Pseudonocardia oceani]MBW0109177.1 hypothetical protein [Pseudonocardia oceani]MBW0123236.1 hypothetical protein [Pseudonocardia oceani]MBW0130725.1 hypothetical protein [Pseudonocardia oceani]